MKKILSFATVTVLTAAGLAAQSKPGEKWELGEPIVIELGDLDGTFDLAQLAPLPVIPEVQDVPPPPPPPDVQIFAGGLKGSYLGVGVTDVDAEAARELKLKDEHGVKVTRVNEGSPAEKAGIKDNDVILEFNGQRVEGVEQFVRMVREVPPGRPVKLLVSRGGQTTTVTATVGDRKAFSREWESQLRRDMDKMREEFRSQRFEFRMPDMPQIYTAWKSRLGIEAEALSPQLAEFFGVKKGVLVRSVTKDSAAEKAGIKAGDVITKVEGEEVDSPSQISAKLRRIEGSKGIPFTIVRNRSEMALQVVVEGADRTPAAREFGPRRIRAVPAPPAPPAPPAQPAPRYVVAPQSM